MKIGVIGLGRMGLTIAQRIVKGGHNVYGFDSDQGIKEKAQKLGVIFVEEVKDLAEQVNIFWIMVPDGKPVDDVLNDLESVFRPGDVVVDGGNSFFKDSMRRHQQLETKGIDFLDCGTSGGLHGSEIGFCLMIGGNKKAFDKISPVFEAVSVSSGFAYVGPAGSGHYVKMIHNGVEYGLLQAYAEGFHMLKNGCYENLDLEKIASLWNHGAIVRSWILELTRRIFSKDQNFEDVSGDIGENLTGKWTVDTAKELNIPVRVIEQALDVRAWSRETGGNYATKLVALLRNEFGGHGVKKTKGD